MLYGIIVKYMVLLIENHLRETEVFRGKFFGGRTMIEFQCDYAEGAHPKILERMIETNMDQTPGYGLDPYCDVRPAAVRILMCSFWLAAHRPIRPLSVRFFGHIREF